jgi:hypothetical protein
MTKSSRVTVRMSSTGETIACASVANTPLRRMRGLLGRSGLEEGDGLVIDPCSSVHTCFMRFAIDVVFVDRDGRVLRAVERMSPFRFAAGGFRARRTLELPAGTIARAGLAPGAMLAMESV